MSLDLTNRLTSKDIRIEYIPEGLVPATHDEDLTFSTNIDGGTFKLRVNGELTADITFDESVQGTTETNIQNALDALPNLSAGDIVVTGSDTDTDSADDSFALAAAADGWYRIEFVDTGLTASGGGEILVQQEVNTQGTEVFVISTQVTQFSYERTVDTVDVTTISEFEGTDIPVKSTMSFDATIYDADEDFTRFVIEEGQSGLFTVYKTGKFDGHDVFAFVGLIENVGEDFPDHEKLEISLSGMRQGAMVIPFGSTYRT